MKQYLFGIIASVIFFALSFTVFALFFERDTLLFYLKLGIFCGVFYGLVNPLIEKIRKKKS